MTSNTVRRCSPLAAAVAAFAFASAPVTSSGQEPAGRITIIELTPHIAVNDAAALIEAQDYAGGIELLEGFLANTGSPPAEAFYLLGVAHYQLGDYAKARPHAEQAATMAPDAPASWLELVADLLKRNGEYLAAIPWLQRLVETAPDNKTYWLELSLAYERAGDLDHALATMRLANGVAVLNEDADFRRLADLLINRGLPQQSAELLEDALARQIVRGDEAAYTKLGTAWFTAGELDKAVFPLENAARAASSGDAYVRLAVVHVAREDWSAAVAALHAGMGRGSLTDEAQAHLLMGVALYRQQQYEEARTYFETAAESAPQRAAAQDYLRAIDEATGG